MNRRMACVVLAVIFGGLTVTSIRAWAQRATDVPILQGSFAVQLRGYAVRGKVGSSSASQRFLLSELPDSVVRGCADTAR